MRLPRRRLAGRESSHGGLDERGAERPGDRLSNDRGIARRGGVERIHAVVVGGLSLTSVGGLDWSVARSVVGRPWLPGLTCCGRASVIVAAGSVDDVVAVHHASGDCGRRRGGTSDDLGGFRRAPLLGRGWRRRGRSTGRRGSWSRIGRRGRLVTHDGLPGRSRGCVGDGCERLGRWGSDRFGRAGRDDQFRVEVVEHWSSEVPGDHFGDQWNARSAPRQDDSGEIARGHAGGRNRPIKGLQRFGDVGAQRRLELVARHAHRGVEPWHDHADRSLTLRRQLVLGLRAGRPEQGDGPAHFVVIAIELLQRATERVRHVREHQLVDLCATETLERLGRTDQRGPGLGDRHDAGVERAAEVVDRNGVARRDPI